MLAVIIWNLLFAGMPRLPSGEELWTLNRKPAVQFVDASGETLAVRGTSMAPSSEATASPYVGQAFIAAEDQRSWSTTGSDLQSIMRAFAANFSAGRTVQGGSTLRAAARQEPPCRRRAVAAAQSTGSAPGDRNGGEAVKAGNSRSLSQPCLPWRERLRRTGGRSGLFWKTRSKALAGRSCISGALPKAPSRYAEDKRGAETTARVHYVLDRMVASGFVTPAAAAEAKAEHLAFVEAASQNPISGYVLDEALKEAGGILPDLPPDAVITLTVDGDLQRRAEAALSAALSVRRLEANEGAILVMDRSGAIRAMVGGRDYKKSQFNRVTQALRQPGSAFKTFVYTVALEQGLDPTTVRDDAPIQLAGWKPGNYEDAYRGPITLAQALAVSSNSVAAQIGAEVGPKQIAKLAKRFWYRYPSACLPFNRAGR